MVVSDEACRQPLAIIATVSDKAMKTQKIRVKEQ